MLYTNMVVAVPGPPWVIRLISPNTLKELITDVMTIKKVVPESVGSLHTRYGQARLLRQWQLLNTDL